MASRTATPWGPADLVEELTLRQQVGGRRFASVVQLLETQKGSGWSASRTRRTALHGAGR
jgi:hypothetical protein